LCPHPPEKGFAGQNARTSKSDLRLSQAKTGMIQSAAEDLKYD